MATRAARAPAERAEGGVRIEALATVQPQHPQRLRQLLDLLRPRHFLREGSLVGLPTGGIVQPEPIEGIDAAVIVGPGPADRVAADQLNLLWLVRIGLAHELKKLPDPRHAQP